MSACCSVARRGALTIWSRPTLLALGVCLASACGGSQEPPAAPAAPEPAAAVPAEAAAAPPASASNAQAIVDAADRTEKDRETDARRHPAQFLEFLGVKSGDKVADLGAGGGYTTELLVRAVGPSGTVYAQNNKLTIEKFVKEPWAERLKRDVNKNVVRLDREYEDPLPPEAKDLDLVTFMFSYHDVIAQNGDRTKLNRAVFQALKPGGSYVIADHLAADGSGLAAANSVHRIEEKIVRQEVEAAGFTFAESADFLKDPADDMSKPSFNVGFNTSRFLLKFKKP
jgi:predicted methyltransferase